MRKRVKVISESESGRNLRFRDNYSGINMSLQQFARRINAGEYKNYHTRTIKGIETPVSNPNGKESNNLG